MFLKTHTYHSIYSVEIKILQLLHITSHMCVVEYVPQVLHKYIFMNDMNVYKYLFIIMYMHYFKLYNYTYCSTFMYVCTTCHVYNYS